MVPRGTKYMLQCRFRGCAVSRRGAPCLPLLERLLLPYCSRSVATPSAYFDTVPYYRTARAGRPPPSHRTTTDRPPPWYCRCDAAPLITDRLWPLAAHRCCRRCCAAAAATAAASNLVDCFFLLPPPPPPVILNFAGSDCCCLFLPAGSIRVLRVDPEYSRRPA